MVNNIQKNNSMLEDFKLSEIERTLKRFQVRYINDPKVGAPVGHLYTKMVEELNIKNPNLNAFINELNSYINFEGFKYGLIKSPKDNLDLRHNAQLYHLLQDKILLGQIPKNSAQKIMYCALGDCDVNNISHSFVDYKER